MILGCLPPRPQEIVPRRMELPADFPDEYKKIGSKRSKFLDLGLPIPIPIPKLKLVEPCAEQYYEEQGGEGDDELGQQSM